MAGLEVTPAAQMSGHTLQACSAAQLSLAAASSPGVPAQLGPAWFHHTHQQQQQQQPRQPAVPLLSQTCSLAGWCPTTSASFALRPPFSHCGSDTDEASEDTCDSASSGPPPLNSQANSQATAAAASGPGRAAADAAAVAPADGSVSSSPPSLPIEAAAAAATTQQQQQRAFSFGRRPSLAPDELTLLGWDIILALDHSHHQHHQHQQPPAAFASGQALT